MSASAKGEGCSAEGRPTTDAVAPRTGYHRRSSPETFASETGGIEKSRFRADVQVLAPQRS